MWVSSLVAEQLTSLGESPDWKQLNIYQEQVTYSDFRWLLDSQYAPGDAAADWITVTPERVLIKRTADDEAPLALNFRPNGAPASQPPRYWRAPAQLPPPESGQPLAGMKIALDPGHIGGDFAAMEHRSWRVPGQPLFREGDFVLEVAQVLKPRLEALGATVVLVRQSPEPVTKETPAYLRARAVELVTQEETLTPGLQVDVEDREQRINALANLLFYRVAEIRARAELVNRTIKPDLVLCLHVDATHIPEGRELAERSYAHYLINGAYSADELSYDDQRLGMLEKLLNGSWREERALANAFAGSFAAINALPPHVYTGTNAIRVDENPYVYARNLMANRLYQCPTVFLEPWVANAVDFYPQFVADKQSMIEKYVDGVCVGVKNYHERR